MKPVVLINPNSSKQTTTAMLGIARQHLPSVVGWTNSNAPRMITDPSALTAAAEDIASATVPEACALIVAAFGDPGAKRLGARVEIPVIGIGAAAARAACQGHVPFAVVTTTPKLGPAIDALMQSEGDGFLGCFFTEGDPETLTADPTALDPALIKACEQAALAGARRVIIGGGPLATAAARIAPTVPVSLVQPLVAACQEVASRTGHLVPRAPDRSRSAH